MGEDYYDLRGQEAGHKANTKDAFAGLGEYASQVDENIPVMVGFGSREVGCDHGGSDSGFNGCPGGC